MNITLNDKSPGESKIVAIKTNILLDNSIFSGVHGDSGGALKISTPTALYKYRIIKNCIFIKNAALYNGGAIYLNEVDIVIMNCTFINNTA